MSTEEILLGFGVGRRHPDDPFFVEGDQVCQANRRLGVFDVDDEELCHKVVECFYCCVPGCMETFNSVFYFDLHYNSVHRYICAECSKQLPSPHLLDLHILEHHDSYFIVQSERKPMYRCYVEQCDVVSTNATERRQHCIADHKFPHDFRFDNVQKQKPEGTKPSSVAVTEKMEVDTNKKKKQKPPKPHARVEQMDTCSATGNTREDVAVGEVFKANEGIRNAPEFKEFSFGRRGRGRRGGLHWFQKHSSTPKPSTLETTMVSDLRESLPESMTSASK